MQNNLPITDIHAREILDSRGNPTVEVTIEVKGEIRARASVPAGASTGSFEAAELRDKEKRYGGLGVERAVRNVNTKLAEALLGKNVLEQADLDRLLREADGTENKSHLGANALLGVSEAAAKAAARALGIPLYRYLGGAHAERLPVPMMNILNGGRHADNTVDLQEFMIMPIGAGCFREGLRMCAEIYHQLKSLLRSRGLSTAVGDEGGFAPDLADTREVLEYLTAAVSQAGYAGEGRIAIAIDAAASELYDREKGGYYFPGESRMRGKPVCRSTGEMIAYYEELIRNYPIVSLEDGLTEEDWEGWKQMTERLGRRVQLVGDDLFVTNEKRLQKGIRLGAGNAILIKPNQIGTVTETLDAIEAAQRAGYRAVISHRSGDTEDDFIADLAVGVNAGQIKTGAPCRMERVAKYNRLLRIEESLQQAACYGNPFA